MSFLKTRFLCRPIYITSRCYCDSKKTIYQIEEEAVVRKERKVYGTPYPEWRRQWIDRDGEWKSKLSVFIEKAPSIGVLKTLQSIPDLNVKVIKEWWAHMKEVQERVNQRFIVKRVELLGPNLAALHYFTFRGASLRLKNSSDWITGKKKTMELPQKFEDGYYVEAIDCSNFQNGGLRYEGCENFMDLNFLKWLSLKNNKHIDQWCLDRIVGQNGKSLTFLDISGCDINANCIFALARMPQLEMLVVTDPGDDVEMQTALSLFEEEKPGLLIKAVPAEN